MRKAVKTGPLLVVRFDDVPGGLWRVGVHEHYVLGARVLDPAEPGLEVDLAQLPVFERVVQAKLKAPLLLLVADGEPVLDKDQPRVDEQLFEDRALAEELAVLIVAAIAHDVLDARSVVPGAIEQNDLAGRWQVLDVALEIPL